MRRPPAPSYQPDTASVKLGGGALVAVLALIPIAAGVAAAMFWGFQAITHTAPTTALQRAPLIPSGPQLEVAPKADRLALEQTARRRIEGYGWVDAKAGVARIPIERAMALQAQRGWPDADSAGATRP